MPQFIVGNEHSFLVRDVATAREGCPPNVTLVRQKSAWSSAALTARILRVLATTVRALEARLGRLQIVLVLDAARIHFAPAVLRACRDCGIWPVLVPAQLTFLLQPLDTRGFAQYNAHLKKAYQAARMVGSDASGDLVLLEFLPCVYSAIRYVLQARQWSLAFGSDGFGCRQAHLGTRVRTQLALGDRVDIASTQPADEQVKACVPRRSSILPSAVWSVYDEDPPRPSAFRLGPAKRSVVSLGLTAPPLMLGPRPRQEVRAVRAARGCVTGAGSSARPPAVVSAIGPAVVYGRTRAETARLKAAPLHGRGR